MNLRRGLKRVGVLAGSVCSVAFFIIWMNTNTLTTTRHYMGETGSYSYNVPDDVRALVIGVVGSATVFALVFLFFFALGWVIAGFQTTTAGEHDSESTDVHDD